MSMEQIIDTISNFDGVLVLAPDADSGFPELAWGDYFFYYAPDGQIPHNVQPYATIVTKDYPDDTQSRLDSEGRWRINIHVGQRVLREVAAGGDAPDFAATDTLLPHPVYSAQGWIAVVNPAQRTLARVLDAVRDAHADARRRYERKNGTSSAVADSD